MYTFRDEIYRKYSVYDFDHEDLSFFKDCLLTVLSDRKLRCFLDVSIAWVMHEKNNNLYVPRDFPYNLVQPINPYQWPILCRVGR